MLSVPIRHIRHIKTALVALAIVLAVASLVVSHVLASDLKAEERHKMEIWAEAMRSLSAADENTDLALVLRVLDGNNTIPVVVAGADGAVQTSRNVEMPAARSAADTAAVLAARLDTWRKQGREIAISLDDTAAPTAPKIYVYYGDSLMLRRLTVWPYVQLVMVLGFVGLAVFALLTSKRSEQDRVWVGLSKETAHQLGTPISSLMAWTEVLRETYPDDALIPEMDKDVQRLRLIADRFSKIGSLPEPVPTDLAEVLDRVTAYMDRRTSERVRIVRQYAGGAPTVPLNAALFEWVIENLCKNAVDAMGGAGVITITVARAPRRVLVDVADTGKGIDRKNLRNVFRPGFTTKRRGWGLGLSLAKRIVEEYHHGRIWVRSSEPGRGTTFRIELPAPAAAPANTTSSFTAS